MSLVVATAVVPLAAGTHTLFLRDVLNTHLALRAYLADALRRGELPLIDPLRAGGQALLGNPNAVPLYPDNLLLLFGSTLWQLNAHFWIHGLVALVAMFALARQCRLGREAALFAGTAYACSGYFLSQMNLYNGVAGAALAPALAAALLASSDSSRRGRALALLGLLWALELVAGDPLLAVLALAGAIGLAIVHERRIPWILCALALLAGTLVAAPQWVELLRLLPASFRGVWGTAASQQGFGTPEPRALFELILPFYFGRPDLRQTWGRDYFGGLEPLYFSLAPGILVLVLLAVSLRRASRADLRLWILAVAGGLVAYSGGSAGAIFASLPGGHLLRFSVKFVIWTALAGALLAGRGFERSGSEGTSRRALLLSLAVGMCVCCGLWAFFSSAHDEPLELFRRIMAKGIDAATFELFRRGWAFTALFQAALLAAFLALGLLRRVASNAVGGAILALHAGSQLILLQPMLVTDDANIYRSTPPLANRVPAAAVIVHGTAYRLFDPDAYGRGHYPDHRIVWIARRAQSEMFPFAGLLAGRRYEFAGSPEGLDSAQVDAVGLALRESSDIERLRVLRATGADFVLMPRALGPEVEEQAELVEIVRSADPLYVYRLRSTLSEAVLLGEVRYVRSFPEAFTRIVTGGLHPETTAIVMGSGEPLAGATGTAKIQRSGAEHLKIEAESVSGGALVVRRAWLPHWRVEIDGRRAPTIVANLTRLAVALPAGRHTVRFWVDRTPLRLALITSVIGLAGLIALARSASSRSPKTLEARGVEHPG